MTRSTPGCGEATHWYCRGDTVARKEKSALTNMAGHRKVDESCCGADNMENNFFPMKTADLARILALCRRHDKSDKVSQHKEKF